MISSEHESNMQRDCRELNGDAHHFNNQDAIQSCQTADDPHQNSTKPEQFTPCHDAEKSAPEIQEKDQRAEKQEDDMSYPPFRVVLPIMISVFLAVFICALDRTIVGVAIPAISDHFQSFDDIAWYEAAYLLSLCTLQLPSGRLYTMFPAKWVFVPLVIVFEVGSIVCASAPTSNAFIVGRAIAGIGGAGILSGATIIIADVVPLQKRPKYQGTLGASFGLSSILGPLVGGVFTTEATWRWCFWLNLPIGGISLAVSTLVLPTSPPAKKVEGSILQKLRKLDPLGTLFLVPGLACLLFALQFGGSQYPWNDRRVIALLVLAPVLLLGFIAIEVWVVGEDGIAPGHIVRQRSVAAGTAVTFGLGGALLISTFYLPIWFQAIKGSSAKAAGVRLLPYFLGSSLFVIASGFVVSKTGYYIPWLIGGCALIVVGSGLLTTFNLGTDTGQWFGFELIVGSGIGMSLQQSINAAQAVVAKEDIPVAFTILAFTQILSGSLFVPACQAVLANTLNSKLASTIPGFNPSAISSSGATNIRNLVPPDQIAMVVSAYNAAIVNVFKVSAGLAGFALLASFCVEFKTVKKVSTPNSA